MAVQVRFLPENITVLASVGEPLLRVAERAGVGIPTGCLMGSCHACVVEWEAGAGEEPEVVRACLTSIPAGQATLTVHLYHDPAW